MTITATVPRSDTLVGPGDVGSVLRAYGFEIFDEADLEVTFESGGVISEPLTVGVDYTVSGVGNNNGGDITLIGAFAGGLVLNDRWAIVRKIVKSRSTDFQTAGPFLAATVNDQFDRVFASIQEHQEALDRRLGFKDAVADLADEGGLLNLSIVQRASQFLAFNSLGNLIVNSVTNPGTAVGVDETSTDASKNKLLSNVLAKGWEDYKDVGHVNQSVSTVASATTTDLSASNNQVIISGTTTITGLGTVAAGALRFVKFSGALILTHNGTSLILPSAANITTVANDTAILRSLGSGNWICMLYQRADGTALVATTNAASVAEMEAGTSNVKTVTPLNQQRHKSASKGWVVFVGNPVTVHDSFNVASVVRDNPGLWTITWDTDFSSANYVVNHSQLTGSGSTGGGLLAQAAGSCQLQLFDGNNAAVDAAKVYVSAYGDQ